jgi:hypothetical protein
MSNSILKEVHDVEFDETKGFQEEDENLDDVRGIQLVNTMKNMDVGDIRPRKVIEVQDDKNQVLSSPTVQVVTNQASTNGAHDNDQSQVKQVQDQQASSTSQVDQLIKCPTKCKQSSLNPPTNQCCKRSSIGSYY